MEVTKKESYIEIITEGFQLTRNIACFDMDSTLIKTKSKKKFSKDADDWVWWSCEVTGKLKECHKANYSIIIISNQNGIKNEDHKDKLIQKIKNISKELNVPFLARFALLRDVYRKPNTGMFDFKYDDAFFVGDAAGRQGDFSASDYKFALNLNIPFYTPEEYFLGHKKYKRPPIFNPHNLKGKMRVPSLRPSTNEVILFVGAPGSGKTTFYKKYLEPLKYEHLNLDKIKTRSKLIKQYKQLLGNKPIVIDETSAKLDIRQQYINIAKEYNIHIKCFIFKANQETLNHNIYYRSIIHGGKLIPTIVYRIFNKNYSEPTLNEGFIDIENIEFKAETDDPRYFKYYI